MKNRFDVKELGQDILISNLPDFDLEQTLSCGQCFRWEKETDESYTGVAFGKVLNIKKVGDGEFLLSDTTRFEFETIWRSYFDLDRDYQKIKNKLSIDDEIMKSAVDFGGGLRLLNQEPWEMLISYIISSNNSISNISRCIKNLSERYGTSIWREGKQYYSFPTAKQLEGAGEEELMECRVGYRCKYIAAAVKLVRNGLVKFDELKEMDYEKAKQELLKIPGVGPKVADCIALFSLGKHEAYPIDVWIKRVTEQLYLKRASKSKEIADFAKEKFGENAGFAQEYLFFYVRTKGIA